jgi:hypothetical protein
MRGPWKEPHPEYVNTDKDYKKKTERMVEKHPSIATHFFASKTLSPVFDES